MAARRSACPPPRPSSRASRCCRSSTWRSWCVGAPEDAREAIWSADTLALLLRSIGLAAAVTATTIAVAVPLAWLTTRTDLPGRRVWGVLCLLPLVIPSYIGAYLMVSALGPSGIAQDVLGVERLPSIYGFTGAWLVLSAFTFPYVLLPVQAVLRRVDPQLEEAARGLGRSPRQVFTSVVLPQLVPAIGAGGLLVALYVLSDFGAVSILRFDSFTRVIYTTYRSSFEREGAAALACLLVLVTLLVLWLEGRTRRSRAYHRIAPGAQRRAKPVPLGRWRWPALGFVGGVVLVGARAAGRACSSTGRRSRSARTSTGAPSGRPPGTRCWPPRSPRAWPPLRRCPSRCSPRATRAARRRRSSALSYAGHALPGIVVALALVFLGTRAWPALYQTLAMLVLAYVILFLPQAIGAIRAALLQIDPHVEEAARSLGRSPLAVLRTITAPLARSGVLAGAALVFLTAVKELPATLLLAPIGFETLATEIWRLTSASFFERGAIPSLVLLAVSAVPLALLTIRGHNDP